MKKLISALFAAVLLAAGLVVSTGGTASADCSPTQYAGCVATRTKVSGPGTVERGTKARVCALVKARGSNVTPVGTVTFKIKRNAGGYFLKRTKRIRGGEACVRTARLFKRGGYSATARYQAPDTSVFLNSSGGTGFDVVS